MNLTEARVRKRLQLDNSCDSGVEYFNEAFFQPIHAMLSGLRRRLQHLTLFMASIFVVAALVTV